MEKILKAGNSKESICIILSKFLHTYTHTTHKGGTMGIASAEWKDPLTKNSAQVDLHSFLGRIKRLLKIKQTMEEE